MSNLETRNLVISARLIDQSISWRSLWDFAELVAQQDGFHALDIEYKKQFEVSPLKVQSVLARLGHAYKYIGEIPNNINATIVICRTPSDLQIINSFPKIRDKSNVVVAYILDSYFREGYPRDVSNYDLIFVSDEDDVEFVRQRYQCRVKCVWQGIDTVRWSSLNDRRSIDLVGFGRTPIRYHREFQKSFHRSDDAVFYLHSPLGHREGPEVVRERPMFFKVLQNSTISLAFHLLFEPEVKRPRSMMLTARWLESLTSGCLILGKAPTSHSAAAMLCWDGATIEIVDDERLAVEQIKDILRDPERVRLQREQNVENMIARHDWRDRLRTIFAEIGLNSSSVK